MNIESYLSERKKTVDLWLAKSLADGSQIPPRLKEAMEYSLAAGGKRLRPILVVASAECVGGKMEDVVETACAIEMIHTFSLIHDDLPSMDNDDLRRGRPTSHKVFGEATAILAGDALVIEAFSVLARLCAKGRVPAEVIFDIADAAGARGMTGGQQIDMESTGKDLSENGLAKLHNLKTGRLISVSVTSGAKSCGADKKEIDALKKYGDAIGLAFQIADDVLDIEGDEKEIGKDKGSDIENKKSTYPSVMGIEASKKKALSLMNDAVSALSIFDGRADLLREIAQYIIERRR